MLCERAVLKQLINHKCCVPEEVTQISPARERRMISVETSKTHSILVSSSARRNWDRMVVFTCTFYLEGFIVFELLISLNTLHLTINVLGSYIPFVQV